MKTTFRIALCGIALAATAVYAADGVKRILDRGRDGDTYYYEVMCVDGSRGSVLVVDGEPPRTCAVGSTLVETCDAAWTLREAASRVCR